MEENKNKYSYSSPQYLNGIYRTMSHNVSNSMNNFSPFGFPSFSYGYGVPEHLPPHMYQSMSSFPMINMAPPFMRSQDQPIQINQAEFMQQINIHPPANDTKMSSSQMQTMFSFSGSHVPFFQQQPMASIANPKPDLIILDSE